MAYECHDVSATETRSPSPSEVTEDVASSEWASSNESPDNKDSNGEEELVYGSYVGSKRKLKLNRKSRASQQMADGGCKEALLETPEETLEVWSGPLTSPVASSDFLEELQRKEQLLATLLQLDQPVDNVTEAPEATANETEQSITIQQPSQLQRDDSWRNSPEPSDLSEVDESSSDDERDERQQQLRDDGIYSKYVDDDDDDDDDGGSGGDSDDGVVIRNLGAGGKIRDEVVRARVDAIAAREAAWAADDDDADDEDDEDDEEAEARALEATNEYAAFLEGFEPLEGEPPEATSGDEFYGGDDD